MAAEGDTALESLMPPQQADDNSEAVPSEASPTPVNQSTDLSHDGGHRASHESLAPAEHSTVNKLCYTLTCAITLSSLSTICLTLCALIVGSIMIYDDAHSSVQHCVDQFDPVQPLVLPANGIYHLPVNSSQYRAIRYSLGNDEDSTSTRVDFVLRAYKYELMNRSLTINDQYVENNDQCSLTQKDNSASADVEKTCYIIRYWPHDVSQWGEISCGLEEDKPKGFLIWKWVPLDGDFKMDCKNIQAQIEESSEDGEETHLYKRWHWCGNKHEHNILNIQKILNDPKYSTDYSIVVMRFCLESHTKQGVVDYIVNFTEQWKVDTQPYNLYRMAGKDSDGYTGNDQQPAVSDSIVVPLTSDDIDKYINISVSGPGSHPVTIQVEGLKRTAHLEPSSNVIPYKEGGIAITVSAVIIVIIQTVFLICYYIICTCNFISNQK